MTDTDLTMLRPGDFKPVRELEKRRLWDLVALAGTVHTSTRIRRAAEQTRWRSVFFRANTALSFLGGAAEHLKTGLNSRTFAQEYEARFIDGNGPHRDRTESRGDARIRGDAAYDVGGL